MLRTSLVFVSMPLAMEVAKRRFAYAQSDHGDGHQSPHLVFEMPNMAMAAMHNRLDRLLLPQLAFGHQDGLLTLTFDHGDFRKSKVIQEKKADCSRSRRTRSGLIVLHLCARRRFAARRLFLVVDPLLRCPKLRNAAFSVISPRRQAVPHFEPRRF